MSELSQRAIDFLKEAEAMKKAYAPSEKEIKDAVKRVEAKKESKEVEEKN